MLKFNQHFMITQRLYCQGRRSNQARNQCQADGKIAGFLFGLYFSPEDGNNTFLRNVVNFQMITRRF
jgi:hypothetical protein